MQEIEHAIATMMSSNKFNGVYCYGDTSMGKTYEVLQALEKLGLMKDTIIFTSHITPLAMFIKAQQNPNKIIFLDDVDEFNDTSIAILKSMLWDVDKKREVCWLTSSKLIYELGLEKQFIFSGKVIITTNRVDQYRKFEPLLARMFTINKIMTLGQIKDVIVSIFNKEDMATHLSGFIDKFLKVYTKDLHIRNVLKWIEYTKKGYSEDADKLFIIDEELKDISEGMDYQAFCVKYSCSRRTYQRKVKKFKELSGN